MTSAFGSRRKAWWECPAKQVGDFTTFIFTLISTPLEKSAQRTAGNVLIYNKLQDALVFLSLNLWKSMLNKGVYKQAVIRAYVDALD